MGHGILFYSILALLAMLCSIAGGATCYVLGVLQHVDDTKLPVQQLFDPYKLLAYVAAGLYLGTAGSLVLFVGFSYLLSNHLSIPDIAILALAGGSTVSLFPRQTYRMIGKRWPGLLPYSHNIEQLIEEKLTLLKQALILETRTDEKMRLRLLIKEIETENG